MRTDEKRSRRLWGAPNQGEANSLSRRQDSKVLHSVGPPLHFYFYVLQSHHNSTSFYINNSDVPCNTGAQPLPGELCAWLNSWRPNVGPVFLGGGGYRSWVPPRGITVPSSSEGPTHHCWFWHTKEHQHDLEAGSCANPGEATFYCQAKMHPRWFGYCFLQFNSAKLVLVHGTIKHR